jgi:hypothetical protein
MLVLVGRGEIVRAGDLKAGATTADITPPLGMPMWGYAARHDAPAVGVRDRSISADRRRGVRWLAFGSDSPHCL